MRALGWRSLKWLTAAVLIASLFVVYGRWRHGDRFYILGIGTVFRFPCSSYRYEPSGEPGVIQAFGVIDGAASAARANDGDAVAALVDAVFDRELPAMPCSNPFRRRVTEAELRFRGGLRPSISERELSETANDVLAAGGAPTWARTSVAQLHLLRDVLRPELPRFIGTVASEYRLSDQLSPVEVAFLAMQLGRGMIYGFEEFQNGPEGWVEHIRALQVNPPAPTTRAVFRIQRGPDFDLERELNESDSTTSRSTNRFLDRLGFPP